MAVVSSGSATSWREITQLPVYRRGRGVAKTHSRGNWVKTGLGLVITPEEIGYQLETVRPGENTEEIGDKLGVNLGYGPR